MATPGAKAPESGEDLFGWSSLGHWIAFTLRAPTRHPWLAAGSLLTVLSLAIAALMIVPFRYEVAATVLARPASFSGALPANRDAETPARDAHEVVMRHENLMAIAQKIDFANRYTAARPRGVVLKDWVLSKLSGDVKRDPDALLDSLVDALAARLQVWSTPEGVVSLSVQWWDRDLAFDIVDAAMQSFIDARHASEIKFVGESVAILETHQAQVEGEIAKSVERLEQKEKDLRVRPTSRRNPGSTTTATPVITADPEVTRLQSELASRRRAITDLEQYRQQRIAELNAELAKEQAIYTPDHPIVQSTERMLDGLSVPSEQVGTLHTEVQGLEQQILQHGGRVPASGLPIGGGRKDEIEEARERVEGGDPRLEFDRKQLAYQLKEYGDLQTLIDGARLQMETAEAAFKHRYSVIQPPELPRGPVKPYGLLFGLGGLLGGMGLALFTSTASDVWRGRVLERWQLEQDLRLPVLAVVRANQPNRPPPSSNS